MPGERLAAVRAEMEYIENKNIFLIMMNTLKLRNRAIVEHGYQTAYIVYRMLECRGGYEMYELADIAIYVTFHDIGAYLTESGETLQTYDVKDTLAHTVLGYLICKYLSPYEDMAPVILYHHTDYNKQHEMEDWQWRLSAVLHIAERAVIYHSFLGEKFNPAMFDRLRGTRLWEEGLLYLKQADEKHKLFRKLESGDYRREMDELLEYMIFSNEEESKYLKSEMYFLGLRGQGAVTDAASCIAVCRCIADRLLLSAEEKRILYYAALLHDVGMLAISSDIVEAPGKLTDSERRLMETHVARAEETLKDCVDPEVLEIILAHHERGDGSGYPRHLKDGQMNRLQRILQVADTFTALIHERSYRPARTKKEVIDIFLEEQRRGRFPRQLVDIVTADFDIIRDEGHREAEKVMIMFQKVVEDYKRLAKQFAVKQ